MKDVQNDFEFIQKIEEEEVKTNLIESPIIVDEFVDDRSPFKQKTLLNDLFGSNEKLKEKAQQDEPKVKFSLNMQEDYIPQRK